MKLLTNFLYVLVIIIIFVGIGFMFYGQHILLGESSQKFHKLIIETNFQTHEQFYNSHFTKQDFNLSIYDFSNLIYLSYDHVEDLSNPCQFYSELWTRYLGYNDIEYKLVWLPNHILVIAYEDEHYYLLDQFIIKKITYA